ncbi:MAG: hypothetical protein RSA65_11045 [Clostridia bacterium]
MAKKYMNGYLDIEARVLALIEKREKYTSEVDRASDLFERATRATSTMTATRVSGTPQHDGMANAVLEMIRYKEYAAEHRQAYGRIGARLCIEIDRLADALGVRLALIERLSDERYKAVMTMRYIDGWAWSRIISACNHALDRKERTVYMIHGEALEEIRLMMMQRQPDASGRAGG